jgi:hypothetical protein
MRIKIVLLVALFVALNSIGFAQGKTKKTAVTPRFTGAPEKQKAAFKSFIIKNIGRRVYLKLTFSEEEPHAYRSQFADPVFSVDRFAYSFECGDRESETDQRLFQSQRTGPESYADEPLVLSHADEIRGLKQTLRGHHRRLSMASGRSERNSTYRAGKQADRQRPQIRTGAEQSGLALRLFAFYLIPRDLNLRFSCRHCFDR